MCVGPTHTLVFPYYSILNSFVRVLLSFRICCCCMPDFASLLFFPHFLMEMKKTKNYRSRGEQREEEKKKAFWRCGANRLKRRRAYLFVSFAFFWWGFRLRSNDQKGANVLTGHRDVMKRKDIRRSTRPNEFCICVFSLFSKFSRLKRSGIGKEKLNERVCARYFARII